MLKRGKNRFKLSKINSLNLLAFVLLFIVFLRADISYSVEPGTAIKFPSKPIKIIITVAPGGSNGQEIRAIAPFLEKYLGNRIIIDYIPGADGKIAYNKFYREKPDGYTLSYFSSSSAIWTDLSSETGKFSVKNISPIASWSDKTFVLLTYADNWKTFSELLNDAKKRTITFAATGGSAEIQYRTMSMATGVKFNYVPYNSSAEGTAAVAGKHVDTMITFTISSLPMVRAGKLKPLAVFSPKPDPFLSGTPTLKETGYGNIPLIIGYSMFAAPPNTPKQIVAILEKSIRNVTSDPEFIQLASNMGNNVTFKSTSELNQLILNDYEVYLPYKPATK